MPNESTTWQDLLSFIESRSPGFLHHIQGAEPGELEGIFHGRVSVMPASAISLFSTLGQNSAGFDPFGPTFTTDASVLLEEFYEESLIDDRFLRVAVAKNLDEMGDADIYIDLHTNDGADAVILQVCDPWDGREPHDRCHSIMSKAIQRAFKQYDLRKWGVCGSVGHSVPLEELAGYTEAMLALAKRAHLRRVLWCRDDLQCYEGDSMSMMFDSLGPGVPLGVNPAKEQMPSRSYVRVWLATDSEDSFRNLAEQVRAWMPPLPFLARWLPESGLVTVKEES